MSAAAATVAAPAARRHRWLVWTPVVGGFMFVAIPIALIGGVSSPRCGAPGTLNTPAGGGPAAAGLYAQPLRLQPNAWYEVGATAYGGPGDPSSSAYGAIGTPGEAYLPAHPDTFAELSVRDRNPANGGTFTFHDANALDELPYMTALRVASHGTERILKKRDVGYGQGPHQRIANGQPYRLDVWWQSARPLHVAKTPVRIELAPATGTGVTLGQLPSSTKAAGAVAGRECPPASPGAGIPLPLVPGSHTGILPSGLAAAGHAAPPRVKAMVAAANRLYGKPYRYGGGHCCSLQTLQPAYDCSSAVSYVLHAGRALGHWPLDAAALTRFGVPGPGRWVSVYATPGHAFIYLAGLRFDTSYRGTDTGPNTGQPGPRWRAYPTVPTWADWTVRHPPSL